jgi:hypothetical protein
VCSLVKNLFLQEDKVLMKTLICTLFGICLISIAAIAQNRTISIIEADSTFETEFNFIDGEAFAHIKNETNSPIQVIVTRTDLDVITGHIVYYCWGPSCYSPSVFTSTDTVTIPAQGIETSFKGYLSPSQTDGASFVRYCFNDITNNSTPTCFTASYYMGVVSVNGKLVRKNGIYPNPATESLVIKRSGPGTAQYEIFDATGRVVVSGQATAEQAINIQSIKSGLYRVVIKENNQVFTESFLKK